MSSIENRIEVLTYRLSNLAQSLHRDVLNKNKVSHSWSDRLDRCLGIEEITAQLKDLCREADPVVKSGGGGGGSGCDSKGNPLYAATYIPLTAQQEAEMKKTMDNPEPAAPIKAGVSMHGEGTGGWLRLLKLPEPDPLDHLVRHGDGTETWEKRVTKENFEAMNDRVCKLEAILERMKRAL